MLLLKCLKIVPRLLVPGTPVHRDTYSINNIKITQNHGIITITSELLLVIYSKNTFLKKKKFMLVITDELLVNKIITFINN